jgi:Protein of unknown function (DUF1552).
MKFVKPNLTRVANRERRQFLDLVARAGVSTSLLKYSPLVMSVFASRYAEAALQTAQKKAVFFYLPDGAPPGFWTPNGSEMNIATAPYGSGNVADKITGYNVAQYCRFYPVTNVFSEHGRIYRALGHSLDSHQIINTVDTQIAKSNGFNTRFSILRVSAHKTEGEGGFSVENGNVSTFTNGAKKVFDLVFSGAQVEEGDSTYKAVFEMNAAAISSIERKLGAEEKMRMQEHLTALQKIEASLGPSSGGDEGSCQAPAIGAESTDIVEHGKALVDVVVAALKCGLTNVASMMLSDTQCSWGLSPEYRTLMDIRSGITADNFHSANHGGTEEPKRKDQARMLAYISQVPAYMISRLAEEKDSFGTPLIDSTLFIQLSEMGYGADHRPDGAPWILASGNEFKSRFGSYSGNYALCKDIPAIMDVRGSTMGELPV